MEHPRYAAWKENRWEATSGSSWHRVDSLPLSLLRRLLCPTPSKRATIAYLKNHLWYKKRFKDTDGNVLEPELAKTPSNRHGHRPTTPGGTGDFFCLSQPLDALLPRRQLSVSSNSNSGGGGGQKAGAAPKPAGHSDKENLIFGAFSQPAAPADHFVSTQYTQTHTQGSSEASGAASQNTTLYQRLVKRLTRFWANTDRARTGQHLVSVAKQMGYTVKTVTTGLYTFETRDRRGAQLSMKCALLEVDGRVLVDFRLSRGCGLEFKRQFAKIKNNCKDVADKKGPILWPALIPVTSIPGIPE